VKSTLVNINVSQTKIDYTANIKHLKNEIGLILYFCDSVQLQVLLCVQFFKREVQENVVQADWCLKWCTYTNTAWVMHWLCDVEFWSTMLGSCWVHKFWVITIMYMLKAMDATLVYKHDIYIYIYIYISTLKRKSQIASWIWRKVSKFQNAGQNLIRTLGKFSSR